MVSDIKTFKFSEKGEYFLSFFVCLFLHKIYVFSEGQILVNHCAKVPERTISTSC